MKKILFLVTILFLSLSIFAQEEDKTKISGEFITDQRLLLDDDYPWVWNENRLSLQCDKKISGSSKFHSDVWFRNMGLPEFYSMSNLYNKTQIDPFNIEIREAYMQTSGFILKNLDFTVGRQFIGWGTADKINPTNNFDAYDFEDLLDFGRRRASDALKLTYYINNYFSVEGVLVPIYRPANLPVGIYSDALYQNFFQSDMLNIIALSDSLILPENKFKENFSSGVSFKGFLAGFDFSVSYVYGRDFLPQPQTVDIYPVDALGNAIIKTELYYPRNNIFGFDLAGEIKCVGVWTEISMVMPADDVILTSNLHTVNPMTYEPMIITADSIILEKNKLYFKYVVGADYSFNHGFYANIQYLHGFLHERGNEELNDYFFIRLDKSLFYDKLKISPVSGAFIISDYSDLENNYALVYYPEISYKPTDNFELILAATIMEGKGDNMFAHLKSFDTFIFKAKYHF